MDFVFEKLDPILDAGGHTAGPILVADGTRHIKALAQGKNIRDLVNSEPGIAGKETLDECIVDFRRESAGHFDIRTAAEIE